MFRSIKTFFFLVTDILKKSIAARLYKIKHKIRLKHDDMIQLRNGSPLTYCFPSSIIHVNDFWVKQNWKFLDRGHDNEEEFKKMIEKVRDYTMVSYDGQVTLLGHVKFCEENGIEGDYVEMGSWKGGCIGLMALANLKYGKSRRAIHVFDSFEGLPGPHDKDLDDSFVDTFKIEKKDDAWVKEPIKVLVAKQEDVEELVFDKIRYPRKNVSFYKGWFKDTLPSATGVIDKVAILRMDGDLYESYMDSLEYLYPHVVSGGFVIIDDWALKGCRDAVEEYFKKLGCMPYLSSPDMTTRYFRKT